MLRAFWTQAHVVDGELDRLDAEVEQIVAQVRSTRPFLCAALWPRFAVLVGPAVLTDHHARHACRPRSCEGSGAAWKKSCARRATTWTSRARWRPTPSQCGRSPRCWAGSRTSRCALAAQICVSTLESAGAATRRCATATRRCAGAPWHAQLVRGLARGGLGLCFLSVGVQLLATMLGHTKRPLRALTERDLADIGQSLGEPAAMLLRNVQYVRGDPARADADKGLARQRHLSYLLHLAGVLDPTPQSKHEDTVDIHLALPAEDPSLLDPLGPKVDVEGITNLYKSVRRRAAAFYAGSQQDAASIFELEIMGDREGVVPWSKTTGLPRALHDMMSFSTYYTCTCLGCGYSSAPKQQRQAVLVVGNGLVQSTGVAANQTYTPHFNMVRVKSAFLFSVRSPWASVLVRAPVKPFTLAMPCCSLPDLQRPCPVCRWSFVSPDLPLSVALTEWLPDEEKKLFATWAKQPTVR